MRTNGGNMSTEKSTLSLQSFSPSHIHMMYLDVCALPKPHKTHSPLISMLKSVHSYWNRPQVVGSQDYWVGMRGITTTLAFDHSQWQKMGIRRERQFRKSWKEHKDTKVHVCRIHIFFWFSQLACLLVPTWQYLMPAAGTPVQSCSPHCWVVQLALGWQTMGQQLGFLNQHHLNTKAPLIIRPATCWCHCLTMSWYALELSWDIFLARVSGLKEEQVSGEEHKAVRRLFNKKAHQQDLICSLCYRLWQPVSTRTLQLPWAPAYSQYSQHPP